MFWEIIRIKVQKLLLHRFVILWVLDDALMLLVFVGLFGLFLIALSLQSDFTGIPSQLLENAAERSIMWRVHSLIFSWGDLEKKDIEKLNKNTVKWDLHVQTFCLAVCRVPEFRSVECNYLFIFHNSKTLFSHITLIWEHYIDFFKMKN